MKKLFQVKAKITRFFEEKKEAKVFRDKLNHNESGMTYHVSRGPDHIGKHGMGRVPYMRRQPKKKGE